MNGNKLKVISSHFPVWALYQKALTCNSNVRPGIKVHARPLSLGRWHSLALALILMKWKVSENKYSSILVL